MPWRSASRLPMVISSMIIWAVWFVAVYALTGVGCRAGWQRHALPAGNLLSLVLVACTLLALALIASAGVAGYRAWRAAREGNVRGQEAAQRQRFMGLAMLMLAVISAIGTVLGVVPVLMLDPCAT